MGPERWKLYAALVAAATVAATALTYGGDSIQDTLYGDGLDFSGSSSGPTPGDIADAALWGLSLYFCSPWQLLLLFLGEVDTERPSDWLLRLLGSATGQPVENPQYSAPLALRAAVVAACAAGGAAIAWAFSAGLGDATWSVSTGLGACIAGAVYEVGRPKRYTIEEAAQLDAEWRDFVTFAHGRLQRSGNLHESEVFEAFRRSVARYRSSEAMPDDRIRDFVRNWAPDVQRTPNGYLKGLSLQQRTDPFTGAATGSATASSKPGAAAEGDRSR